MLRFRRARVEPAMCSLAGRFVLDPDAPLSPLQAAERLSLRSLAYSGTRFPEPVLHDSARAVESHPDVVLMPPAFLIVERTGTESSTPGSGLQATAHDARRTLAFALTWMEPRTRGLIPYDAEPEIDAHTVVAENTSPPAAELAVFADAAHRLRAGQLNEVEAHDTVYRIGRARRLLRWGRRRTGKPTLFRHQHPRPPCPPPAHGRARHRPLRRAGGRRRALTARAGAERFFGEPLHPRGWPRAKPLAGGRELPIVQPS
ncbi:DUF5954 family protein [Streptomyces sp. NPDC015492]|uniref:DUF5954 family protein n=1 Tax=Streptomyces sp. NPDC015492 TaxID=3364958 RepID=UPI0036FB07C2